VSPGRSPARDAVAVLAWRLGLGPLLGRRVLLLTTRDGSEGRRRTVLPYRSAGGTIYLLARDPDTGWRRDLAARPDATIQAAPGPRGVTARAVTAPAEASGAAGLFARRPPADLIALEPTGRPTPPMTPPGLVWLWPALAALLALRAVIRGRRR